MTGLALLATVSYCAVNPMSDVIRLPDTDRRDVSLELSDFAPPPHPAAAVFAEYWPKIASNAAPRVTFAVDASVSKSGRDAYTVVERDGTLAFTGSNDRSLFYAVYDFFAKSGCRWYWDGDRLPAKGVVDVRGTKIVEESRYEYRGTRYFAHRGLARFQCEHWGFEDWRREIDWCVKNRLNVVMLRIGMDDTWQKAFPEIVKYPDPAKPIPEALDGYDNRSLFWSLEYRGLLRKVVTDYAVSRGLEVPTDFGTVSHWYSRTPKAFLAAKKPPFMPQATSDYSEDTGRVWDIRQPGWLDEYWKLTEAQIAAGYGGSNLLHTIGFGERRVFKDRAENLKLKIDVNKQLVAKALSVYPSSKVLLAGWDFFYSWQPEEVRALIPHLDPKTTILWDYEADAPGEKNFTNWGVVGKFPYTFSIFLTFEMGLDVRANYKLIEERFAVAKDDPMCKGFIFWPESAHTDTFLLKYFTDNVWRPDGKTLDARLAEFCRERYGADAATMAASWKDVMPASTLLNYWGNAPLILSQGPVNDYLKRDVFGTPEKAATLASAPQLFARLAEANLADSTVCRDVVDLARTETDRLLLKAQVDLTDAYDVFAAAPTNRVLAKDVETAAKRFETLWTLFADLLAQHEDYSLDVSLRRLHQTARVRNPNFAKVLFDNACNRYCTSHQYEVVAGVTLPYAQEIAAAYRAAIRKGAPPVDVAALKARYGELVAAAAKKSLGALGHRTRRPISPDNLRRVLEALAKLK